MKKSIIIFLSIFILLVFTSCGNKTKSNEETQTFSQVFNKTTTQKTETENFVYEKIIFEIMHTNVPVNINKTLNDQFEKAKTVTEPLPDQDLTEMGKVWVQYKNSEDLVEYGKFYFDKDENTYILYNDNPSGAVLLIPDFPIEEQVVIQSGVH